MLTGARTDHAASQSRDPYPNDAALSLNKACVRDTLRVQLADFDRLSISEQQVAARSTFDAGLQHHILWKGHVSCWPFLAANSRALDPGVLDDLLVIVVGRHFDGETEDAEHIKAAYDNLARYAPRARFELAVQTDREERRRVSYFKYLRERGVPIDPRVSVPDDWSLDSSSRTTRRNPLDS